MVIVVMEMLDTCEHRDDGGDRGVGTSDWPGCRAHPSLLSVRT